MKVKLYDIGETLYAVGLKQEILPQDNEDHNWFDIIWKGKLVDIKINSKGIFYGIQNYTTEYFLDYLVYNNEQNALNACSHYDEHYQLHEISTNEDGEVHERFY